MTLVNVYENVYDEIRKGVAGQLATIKDVAKEAGVSVATVSRTLNRTDRVSPEVRERVVAAVESLSYRPNAVARSLRARNTRTLGLVIPNVENPFFTQVARAVEDAARERGYSLVFGNTDEDPEKEDRVPGCIARKAGRRPDR